VLKLSKMKLLFILLAILVLIPIGCGHVEASWEDQYIDWYSDYYDQVQQSFNNVSDALEDLKRDDDASRAALQSRLVELALTAGEAYNVSAPSRLTNLHANVKLAAADLMIGSSCMIVWLYSENRTDFDEAISAFDNAIAFTAKANDALQDYIEGL